MKMLLHLLPLCSHTVKFVFIFGLRSRFGYYYPFFPYGELQHKAGKQSPEGPWCMLQPWLGLPGSEGPDPVFPPGVAEGSQKLKQFLSSAPNYKSRSFVPILTTSTLLREFQIYFP